MSSIRIVGFDSAWADKTQGAICSISIARDGAASFNPPFCVSFDAALAFIVSEHRACDMCIVALDQPTIVPNSTGCRAVDKIAGSVVGFIGGGVQPACRSKAALFGDNAPIWRFLGNLRATENPDESRVACRGLFIIEVFPALALPAFNVNFYGHRQGPKYNPDNRKQFRQSDWCAVANTIAQYARAVPIDGLETWAHETAKIETPVKGHQDQIDAVLCALIGYHWRTRPREHSIMIGDLANGYMISPASVSIVERLKMKAMKLGIQLQKSA